MTYADTNNPTPETIVYEMQPYGRLVLGELHWGRYNGAPTLHGVVVHGSETSRLLQHSLTKSVVGQHRTIYGVKQDEIERGEVVRIAM